MLYTKPNRQDIDRYLVIYRNGSLYDCMLGVKSDCRICRCDSYMQSITDPEVFLEYVAYPIYLDEDAAIKLRMSNELNTLIHSTDPVAFYQSVNFFCGETMLSKIYGELPFCMFDKNNINQMHSRFSEMKSAMSAYQDGDFAKYKGNMYDTANYLFDYFVEL